MFAGLNQVFIQSCAAVLSSSTELHHCMDLVFIRVFLIIRFDQGFVVLTKL
jgi:hypothetical protein